MDQFVKFLLTNVATGIAFGWLICGAMLAANFQGMADTVAASSNPPLVLAIVAFSAGPFFGVCYLATALIFIGEND